MEVQGQAALADSWKMACIPFPSPDSCKAERLHVCLALSRLGPHNLRDEQALDIRIGRSLSCQPPHSFR